MASGLHNSEAALLLACSLNGNAYTRTTGTYLALLTAAAGVSSGGTEVTGGSYARQGPVGFTVSGAGASNSGTVNFAGMPGATVPALKLMDAASGGNQRWHGDLTTPRTTNPGDTISFAPGAITVALQPT